jgi:hypothetical protein
MDIQISSKISFPRRPLQYLRISLKNPKLPHAPEEKLVPNHIVNVSLITDNVILIKVLKLVT